MQVNDNGPFRTQSPVPRFDSQERKEIRNIVAQELERQPVRSSQDRNEIFAVFAIVIVCFSAFLWWQRVSFVSNPPGVPDAPRVVVNVSSNVRTIPDAPVTEEAEKRNLLQTQMIPSRPWESECPFGTHRSCVVAHMGLACGCSEIHHLSR